MGRVKDYYHDAFEMQPFLEKYILKTLASKPKPVKVEALKGIVCLLIARDLEAREILDNSTLSHHELLFEPFVDALLNLSRTNRISCGHETSNRSYWGCTFNMTLKQLWRYRCELVEK